MFDQSLYDKARRNNTKQYILSVLKQSKCVFCSCSNPLCLQFHHLDRSTKDFDVSKLINHRASIAKCQKEFAKCVVICSNCHSILEALINDNYRAKSF